VRRTACTTGARACRSILPPVPLVTVPPFWAAAVDEAALVTSAATMKDASGQP
jgi:hypothetical protein